MKTVPPGSTQLRRSDSAVVRQADVEEARHPARSTSWIRVRTVLALVGLAVPVSCGYSPGSAEDVAERIACKGFESVPAPTLATEAGTCTSYYEERVTVLYFDENSARDDFLSRRTPERRRYLVGDHFAVQGPERTLGEMRLVIDGEIVG